MKTRFKVLLLILIAAGSFLAGSWVTYQGGRNKATAERKILHYVDPMNPAFKSDKPGIAPCGMPLEPVYADRGDAAAGGADPRTSLPPGTIRISPDKQQLIGVKTATVEKVPWNHTLRVLGRVTPDETRTYRINAAANGWIEDALPVTTGSLVKENDILATYYSLEYRNLVQNYFNLINITKEGSPGEKAVARTSRYSTGQLRQLREAASAMGQAVSESSQIEYYRRNLYNFGMSPYQVDEMERTRTIPDFIEIRAPIGGFILYRNVSTGLRFDRGTEFFRIADLSRVWILADIFETEASYFKPGMRVRMELPYQKRTLYAEVSPVLPQFDPATRTLKVRLEAENPGYVMRPDMFVNVELPVSGPPAIIVPVDAVLDSGLKKTVFVDKGNGFFEPRHVETGRTLGERVEIARGLAPGEKIVVSGNFLIDSEARMQQAASGIFGKIGRDPVCRMNIDEDRAKAEGNVREYKGKSYFFCTAECRDDFGKDPERYLKSAPAKGAMPIAGSQDAALKHAPHSPAAVSKPRGVKAAPEAHDGMTMPAAQPPAAMPGMPAAAPKFESKTGGMAMPSAAAPGMGPQLPASPGQGGIPMSMPQGAAPMAGPQAGAAIPGPKPGEMFPPAAGAPAMNQPPQVLPGTGPGGMPLSGPPGASPMPGGKAGEMIPPATGGPEVK
jgi:Cu(I)/Ag(I) efflux system membrane fusion protein